MWTPAWVMQWALRKEEGSEPESAVELGLAKGVGTELESVRGLAEEMEVALGEDLELGLALGRGQEDGARAV